MEGEYKTLGLAGLTQAINASKLNKKHFIVLDKHGSVATFMQYQANLNDFFKSVVKVTMEKATTDEVLDELRASMVHSMRQGKLFVINISQTRPDFKTTYLGCTDVFPCNEIFNIEEWAKHEVHKKIIREEENVDAQGN